MSSCDSKSFPTCMDKVLFGDGAIRLVSYLLMTVIAAFLFTRLIVDTLPCSTQIQKIHLAITLLTLLFLFTFTRSITKQYFGGMFTNLLFILLTITFSIKALSYGYSKIKHNFSKKTKIVSTLCLILGFMLYCVAVVAQSCDHWREGLFMDLD